MIKLIDKISCKSMSFPLYKYCKKQYEVSKSLDFPTLFDTLYLFKKI